MIGNIWLEIINLSVSTSFTEACLAMFHPTRRWRPVLLMAAFVPCSLCHISHCVTICCSKASLSLQHSSSASNLSAADGRRSFEMVSQMSRHSDFMYFVY